MKADIVLNKQRNIALDLLKVVAVFLITNSHFISLYKDVNPALATGGVPGDAIFFWASGFALTLGSSTKGSFNKFVKSKLKRIYPTFFVWNIVASLVYAKQINWQDFLILPEYWFIQCIFILYIIIFPFLNLERKTFLGLLSFFILLLVLMMVLLPYPDRSMFNDLTLRYFCFEVSFVLGLYCGIHNVSILKNKNKYDIMISMFLFILYFVVISFGKAQTNWKYYTEIIALIPLNAFIYYLYKGFSNLFIVEHVKNNKYLYWIVKFLSILTLQIYVVQFCVITPKFNNVFPLNILIVFALILFWAYILKVVTNLFEQTLTNESWNIKKAFTI